MKGQWQRLALKIDALSLRERAMAFAIAALALVTLIDTFALSPMLTSQKQHAQKIKLDQQQIAAMQAELKTIIIASDIDPDAANKARLLSLKQQSEKLRADLGSIQKSLVSPDKMASLLEDLLKKNRHLQLVSLKTMPVALLSESEQGPGKAATDKSIPAGSVAKLELPKSDAKAAGEFVYKHGVELVVKGRYPDIVSYLSQLEGMPWRLFWAKASLNVDEYPNAVLTLTLYTLSLDKTWLNI